MSWWKKEVVVGGASQTEEYLDDLQRMVSGSITLHYYPGKYARGWSCDARIEFRGTDLKIESGDHDSVREAVHITWQRACQLREAARVLK